ncbi:MAG: hypothetical protein ACLQUY_02245 [Ktedonobacterales bacterium]
MIHRNGKVYISHIPEDAEKYASLVAKLNAKQIDCWTTISPEDSDSYLSETTQKEISGRDVFLRICTTASAQSPRMQLEAWSFGATQGEDANTGTRNQHIRIDLVMDRSYTPEPDHQAYLTIDTTRRPMNDWLVVLYKEMGRMQATRQVSRRTTAIVVGVCVVAAVLVLTAVLVLLILLDGTVYVTPSP